MAEQRRKDIEEQLRNSKYGISHIKPESHFTPSTQITLPVNCLNCGAAVDIHSDKCEYCGTPYVEKLTLTDGEYLTVKLETELLARALDQCRLNDYVIKALERTGRGF